MKIDAVKDVNPTKKWVSKPITVSHQNIFEKG